jgi:3D (Asp-Asp-Asp) domain-containing protein
MNATESPVSPVQQKLLAELEALAREHESIAETARLGAARFPAHMDVIRRLAAERRAAARALRDAARRLAAPIFLALFGWAYNAFGAENLSMIVTGYCPCRICCGRWAGGPTASGVMPAAGVTAAGPRAWPFGTRVRIPGLGERIIQDRLAPASDGRLDVFFATHAAARRWGRRELTVTRLPGGKRLPATSARRITAPCRIPGVPTAPSPPSASAASCWAISIARPGAAAGAGRVSCATPPPAPSAGAKPKPASSCTRKRRRRAGSSKKPRPAVRPPRRRAGAAPRRRSNGSRGASARSAEPRGFWLDSRRAALWCCGRYTPGLRRRPLSATVSAKA